MNEIDPVCCPSTSVASQQSAFYVQWTHFMYAIGSAITAT